MWVWRFSLKNGVSKRNGMFTSRVSLSEWLFTSSADVCWGLHQHDKRMKEWRVSGWGVVWWGSGSWFGWPVALGELETIFLTVCPPLLPLHSHRDTLTHTRSSLCSLTLVSSCRSNLRYEVEPGWRAWLYRWCNKLVSLLFEVTYRGNGCHTTHCGIWDVLQCKLSHKVWERGKHSYPFIHLIKLFLESYSSSRAKGCQHALFFFPTKEALIKRLSCVCLPKRPQKHLK